jgi:hypothetical protein
MEILPTIPNLSKSYQTPPRFPNTTYNFKEVGEKGKEEPKCVFDIKT